MADRERVFGLAADHAGLARLLPGHFLSVRVRSRRGGVSVVEERVRVAGRDMVMTTRQTATPPRMHEVVVLGGDAKGSRIVETYEAAGRGTLMRVDADIRPGGLAGIAAALARGRVRDGLAEVVDGLARAAEGGRGA